MMSPRSQDNKDKTKNVSINISSKDRAIADKALHNGSGILPLPDLKESCNNSINTDKCEETNRFKSSRIKLKYNSPKQGSRTERRQKNVTLRNGDILISASSTSSEDGSDDLWVVTKTMHSPCSSPKVSNGCSRSRPSPSNILSPSTRNKLKVSPIKLRRKIQVEENQPSPPKTPRQSSCSQHIDIHSPKRIASLRNRSDLKCPVWLGEDDFTSSPKRYSLRSSPRAQTPVVQSPRTPSLRKQVLEANTPKTAKKQLMLECLTPKSEKVIQTPESSDRTPQQFERSATPKSARKKLVLTPNKGTPNRGTPTTPTSIKRVGQGFLTPIVAERSSRIVGTPKSELEVARVQLHVSTVPTSLPCREKEFTNVHTFLLRKMQDRAGGCMYISGVPGTGKTATVHAVVRELQRSVCESKISDFDFVEVNGLRLTEPRQAYVRIFQSLTNQKLTAEQAERSLDKKFSSKAKKTTILLVDELDYLCNRRQDVIYNILEWTTKQSSRLVVLTIANTMDLPERTLKGKVTSRMGLTRLVFQPYTYQQLQQIVLNRLAGNSSFHPDAVQLVARKVAAVSGDARRALDICRRAIELVESTKENVSVAHVETALSQIFTGARVLAVRSCSLMWQFVLRAIRDEILRTGVEETNVAQVYAHLNTICVLEGSTVPTTGEVLSICIGLARSGLIVAEKGRTDIHKKISLNISSDDIHYALSYS